MRDENKSVDILKMVLSIFIINGHTVAMCFFDKNFITYGLIRMLVSLAVPLFFLMSSYYFFSVPNIEFPVCKCKLIKLFRMYILWSVILTPFYGWEGGWLSREKIDYEGLKSYLINFVFLGRVGVLWYINALIVGLILTYVLIKLKTPKIVLLLIMLLIITFMSMGDAWHGILSSNVIYSKVWNWYITHFGTFRSGGTYGLLFGIAGYLLRCYEVPIKNINTKIIVCTLLLVYFLYACEGWFLYNQQSPAEWGMYFTTVPLSILLFTVIKRIKVNISDESALGFRKISSLNYFVHMPVLIVYKHYYSPMLAVNDGTWAVLAFVYTLVFSTWISTLIYCCKKIIKHNMKD